jgi:acid phosphatase type 7
VNINTAKAKFFPENSHGESETMNPDKNFQGYSLPGKKQSVLVVRISLLMALGFSLMSSHPISATAQTTSVIIAGAGDISSCSNNNDYKTAQLLGQIAPSFVFVTGDNAYDSGSSAQYTNCYHPTWGKYKNITKPVPGNVEYKTSGASGYFNYFGVPKYYAYNAGAWRIYALNSEIDTSSTSAQVQWLKNDLAANPKKCVLAYWHRPRWSSGVHGSDSKVQSLWKVLYDGKAELVINGHDHSYERFAMMNANGQAAITGLREIVVGTGGSGHTGFGAILSTSRVRNANTYGVLRLILRSDGYDWKFIPISGQTFSDRGGTDCH